MSNADLPEVDSSGAKRAIWSTFARALDTELREDTVIRGSSGLEHEVEAIAVDDHHKRVIIVSAEPNPRMAAMMQVDVQATMQDAKVLVARPVAIDLPEVLRRIVQPLGLTEIDIAKARVWLHSLKDNRAENDQLVAGLGVDTALVGSFAMVDTMPAMPQILSLVAQAGQLPWSDIGKIFGETAATGSLDLSALLATDSLGADLHAGICPIPLFEFSPTDIDMFLRGDDIDAVRTRLKGLGIHQYFYPSRDQLALGLIDQGLHAGAEVATIGEIAPALGHPFGESELVDKTNDFVGTLAALKEAGYVAEGELGIEIGESGRTMRSTIKVRPREGLLTKLINRVSVSLSPLDMIK
ncbi:hypothetical protein QCD71_18635 [Sphingomonas sp. PsM26]|jgi:hypothetical protein|nr:hypothetical protein [Sphingomonas sp. PsM26]